MSFHRKQIPFNPYQQQQFPKHQKLYKQQTYITIIFHKNSQKMSNPNQPPTQLTHNRIKSAFNSLSYSQQDYISHQTLQQILSRLSNQQFDHDVLQQLWQQCKLNSQGYTKISTFIDNVIRAQAILIQKQKQTIQAIKNVESKLTNRLTSNQDKLYLNKEYNQLLELKSNFVIDLEIIRKPFRNYMTQTVIPIRTRALRYQIQNQNQIDDQYKAQIGQAGPIPISIPVPISNKQNLSWIFYLAIIGIVMEVLVYLYLNAFMNTVLFLLILSLYLFQHFDKLSIRFLFWFTCFTLIVDIIWYVISARHIWQAKEIGIWPQFLGGYLKLSVILISCVFVLKTCMAVLLCSEYNIDQTQPQEVDVCGRLFVLKSDNPDAPLKKGLMEFVGQGQGQDNRTHQGGYQVNNTQASSNRERV